MGRGLADSRCTTEEKGSDVNLATHLLHDAHMDRFDVAVVASNDSDLLGPIKWLMRTILQKGIKPFLFLFFAQELRALFENLKTIAARSQTNPINLQPNLA